MLMQNKFSKLLRSECPPPRDSWLFAEGKHEGIVRDMTLEECLGNHPVITPLSPRNHPLLSRVWKYVACMLLALVLGVGNVWGTTANQGTYYLQTPGAETPALTGDFYTTATLNQSQSCTYDAVNYTKTIKLGGSVTAASGNNYPDRMVRYDCKTTATDFTFVVYNAKTTAYKYYISSVKENTLGSANTVSDFTSYDATNTKGVYYNTTTYSVTCTSATRASVYFTVGNNNLYIVQIIATEKGEDLLTPGTAGYSVNFNKGRLVARSGTAVTLDDFLEINQNQNYAAGNTTSAKMQTNNTHYIKFAVATPMLLNFTTSSTTKYSVGDKGTTTNPITPTANKAQKIKLPGAGTYYINPNPDGGTSNMTPTGMSFEALYTLTYNAGTGSGSMEADYGYYGEEVKLPDCTFTAPTSSEFNGWVVTKTASGDAVTVTKDGNDYKFTMPAEAVTVTAQWAVATPKYTVIYKDGETELKRVPVEVGQTPEAYTPTKDFYTFASWSTNPSTLGSTAANAEVELTASWTPNYAFGAYSFNALTVGTSPAKTINGNEVVYDDPFRVDNFYFDGGIKIQGEVGTDAEGLALDNFKGWKLKTTGKNIKFLVENNCQVKVAVGSANTLKVIYTALDGTEKNVNLAQQTETPYLVKGGTIVTLQTTTGSTITLKRIEISALYDATLTDTKSDGSASKPSVAEVTLPTPTAVSGWTYTGWIATQDVKDSEDNTKTAGTLLAAGTYTLTAPTAFTAQWVQLYAVTYDNNGGEGIMTDSNSPYAEGAEVTLLANAFTEPENKVFGSWVATYNDGEVKTLTITDGKFTMPAFPVTVTAQWVDDNKVAKIGDNYYESLVAAVAAAQDNDVISLLKNAQGGGLKINKSITIDFGGFTYSVGDPAVGSTGTETLAVQLLAGNNITFQNGTLDVYSGATCNIYRLIQNYSNLTLTNMTLDGTYITYSNPVYAWTLTTCNGTVTLGENTRIIAKTGGSALYVCAASYNAYPNGTQVTMGNNVTIDGNIQYGKWTATSTITDASATTLTITGGTVNGEFILNTTGEDLAAAANATINVSGGVFNHPVPEAYCADGYAPKDNGNNTYGVKPLATSIDFEALADTHGTGTTDVRSELEAKNYTFSGSISTSNGASWDAATAAKPADKGLKIKGANGTTLSFDVAAGKLVTLKVGSLKGGATIAVNGGTAEELTGSNPLSTGASVYTYYYSADVATYSIAITGTDYDVIQSVTIEDPYVVTFNANGGEDVTAMEFHGTALTLPSATKESEVFKGWYDAAEGGNLIGKANESYTPTADVTLYAQWEAVSSDATLSALEVDGATVAGFDPETYIYNIVCEYGQQPTITKATATAGTLATVTINNTPVDEGTYKYVQVKVVPQSGEEGKKFYQVRYTNKPKLGVSLIKATHTGAKTADVTGYLGGTYDKNTASDGKLGDANTYFGIKLAEGNFQAGDVLYIHASTVSSAVRIYSDKGTTRINAEDGTFDANKMFTYTLTAETEWIYIYRKVKDGESDMNPYVDYIEVQRHMAPFIESFEIEGIGALNINPTTKAITASVPESFDVTALTPTIKAWANGSAHLDKSGAKDFTNPVTYTVTSDYAEDGEVTYTVTITKVAPSATPVIATQPAGDSYVEGVSVEALTVAAEPTAGTLSYQWQVKNGEEWENIDGATAASYTPVVSAIGSYTYRVVVTNTEESKPATSVNSNEATIVITADPSCATFAEASIPTAEPYQYTNTGEWTIYNANSSGKRNGSDQVFTNVKDFEGNTVKGYAKERCVMIFEKDMKQVRFYSANAQRAWGSTPVQVSGDVEAFLGTSTPSYSADAATTSLIQADPSNNKEQIFIAEGEFLAGKVYWFAFSGSLQIFQICAVEADPKAEAPVFANVLADEAICEGGTFATLNATASPVTSYAWYKDGVVIDGAEAATYTPTEAGTYYCIATNAQAGHRPNSLKSAEAVLSVKAAASVTMANVSGKATASIALNAVATGANPHYVWYTCDDAEGNNAVAIPGADDAASYAIPTPVATQYYKVVVTTDCGSVSAVALVTLLPDIVPLADVTESTVWDWAEITARADGSAIDVLNPSDDKVYGPEVLTEEGLVLANYVLGGGNWDKIEGNNGAYSIRNSSNKFYQGASLHMHTTKGGILTIRARNEGHAMTLKVENEGRDMNLGALDNWKNYTIYVKAGDVTIYNVPANGTYPMRVEKITFTVKESPDYPRDVTNNYGTLCVDHNVLVGGALGATFYQIASRNETYPDKIDFEEVMPGEELKAGEPYIFKSNTGKIELYYGETVADGPVAVRGMIGNYESSTLDIDEENKLDILYIANNKLYNCSNLVGGKLILNDHRAYIKMSDVPTYAEYQASQSNSQPNNARRRVTLSMNGTNSATDIDNIFGNDTKAEKVLINGQLFILRGGKMFDATGRLVK